MSAPVPTFNSELCHLILPSGLNKSGINLNLLLQRFFVNDIQHTSRYTERVATVPNKQGHVSAQTLILIRVAHKQLHPLNTPAIHPKCLRNICVPKQIHFTLKTPPSRRTDPHMETQWVCSYGGTGCGEGWRVRVTPACPSRLIFGQCQGKRRSAWCNATIFQKVNARCLFSLSC